MGSLTFNHWYEHTGRGLLGRVYASTSSGKPSMPDAVYSYRPSGAVASRQFLGGSAVPLLYTVREALETIGNPATTAHPFAARYTYHPNGLVSESEVGQLGRRCRGKLCPSFSRIESPKAVAEAALSLGKERDPHVVRAIAYACAQAGDVERAKRQFQQRWNLLNPAVSWHQEMGDQARGLEALLLSDPEAAQRKLREWEGETLRNLGLNEFKRPLHGVSFDPG